MIVRRLLLALLALLLALAGLVWAFNFLGRPAHPRHRAAQHAAFARAGGARPPYLLARVGDCMLQCHTERGSAPYAGGRAIDTPFGTVYASNLTPDSETGLGAWSAAHFRRALHEGRSRDGRLLYPVFPYTHTTRVTDADADALFDFLRSLPPVNKPNREHRLRWPYNTQAALAVWRTLYFRPEKYVPDAAQTPEWNRGAYLVRGLGHCGACHGARNALGGLREALDLSGGLIPMQNWYAPSLASPSEAGVADWPLQDIVQLLATGAAPHATVLGPMAEVVLNSTQFIEAADLRAMAVYLKSLPPTSTDTDPREVLVASAPLLDRGRKLYDQHCADCHGDQGQGVPGAYPALAGNRAVTLPSTENLVQVVLHGGFPPATRGNPRPFGMPPFATTLSDADVAAVITYLRAAWNNKAAPVSELTVGQQRSSTREWSDNAGMTLRPVVLPAEVPGRLWLGAMPGRFDSWSIFEEEAARTGLGLVVCLAPRAELVELSPQYHAALVRGGLDWRWMNVPMRNFGLPEDPPGFRRDVASIAQELRHGRVVLLHCAAGLGRTGSAAACLLKSLGLEADAALQRVRAAGSNPQNAEQSGLVHWF